MVGPLKNWIKGTNNFSGCELLHEYRTFAFHLTCCSGKCARWAGEGRVLFLQCLGKFCHLAIWEKMVNVVKTTKGCCTRLLVHSNILFFLPTGSKYCTSFLCFLHFNFLLLSATFCSSVWVVSCESRLLTPCGHNWLKRLQQTNKVTINIRP